MIIDFNKTGADLTNYWDSAVTQEHIDSAVTIVDADIAELSGVVQEQQIVFSSGYNELHIQVMELSGRTVDLSGYYTSAQTEDAIAQAVAAESARCESTYLKEHQSLTAYTPTTGFSTINGSAITNGDNLIVEGGDMSAYWTSAETKDYIDEVVTSGVDLSHYWTSAQTKTYVDSAVTGLQDQIDDIDDVIPAAITDINDRMVSSSSVKTIWKGTQAEYDAATESGATANPATFYIIVSSN